MCFVNLSIIRERLGKLVIKWRRCRADGEVESIYPESNERNMTRRCRVCSVTIGKDAGKDSYVKEW